MGESNPAGRTGPWNMWRACKFLLGYSMLPLDQSGLAVSDDRLGSLEERAVPQIL
jgi:hypothetical protein